MRNVIKDDNKVYTSGLTREEYYKYSPDFDDMVYPPQKTESEKERRKTLICFWFLGCLNNSSFVIMIAAATTISSGAIGLVYIASICPGVIMKTSAPYWFDHVSYRTRIYAAALLECCSFLLVALEANMGLQLLGVACASAQCSIGEASMLALASRYVGENEENPGAGTLTAWSSGTGFAGVFGYAWLTVLHTWIGLTFTATILLALILPVCWISTFLSLPHPQHIESDLKDDKNQSTNLSIKKSMINNDSNSTLISTTENVMYTSENSTTSKRFQAENKGGGGGPEETVHAKHASSLSSQYPSKYQGYGKVGDNEEEMDLNNNLRNGSLRISSSVDHDDANSIHSHQSSSFNGMNKEDDNMTDVVIIGDIQNGGRDRRSNSNGGGGVRSLIPQSLDGLISGGEDDEDVVELNLTAKERLSLVASLWPYTIPLLIVYISEYAMQSGVWGGIGFPERSEHARSVFYEYANWCYQLGVFASRSSGTSVSPNLKALWMLPVFQACLLGFFWADAVESWWPEIPLLLLCMVAGLAGGAVYVHGFKLLSKASEPRLREISVAAASVAADTGILIGSVLGLFIQACIYHVYDIDGAQVSGSFCNKKD